MFCLLHAHCRLVPAGQGQWAGHQQEVKRCLPCRSQAGCRMRRCCRVCAGTTRGTSPSCPRGCPASPERCRMVDEHWPQAALKPAVPLGAHRPVRPQQEVACRRDGTSTNAGWVDTRKNGAPACMGVGRRQDAHDAGAALHLRARGRGRRSTAWAELHQRQCANRAHRGGGRSCAAARPGCACLTAGHRGSPPTGACGTPSAACSSASGCAQTAGQRGWSQAGETNPACLTSRRRCAGRQATASRPAAPPRHHKPRQSRTQAG